MTKAEIVSQIAQKTGLIKSDVQLMIEVLFQEIQDAMMQGKKVSFRGFGMFSNKKRARKIARDITQNTALVVEAHYVPSFTPSKTFAAEVRQKLKITQEGLGDE